MGLGRGSGQTHREHGYTLLTEEGELLSSERSLIRGCTGTLRGQLDGEGDVPSTPCSQRLGRDILSRDSLGRDTPGVDVHGSHVVRDRGWVTQVVGKGRVVRVRGAVREGAVHRDAIRCRRSVLLQGAILRD